MSPPRPDSEIPALARAAAWPQRPAGSGGARCSARSGGCSRASPGPAARRRAGPLRSGSSGRARTSCRPRGRGMRPGRRREMPILPLAGAVDVEQPVEPSVGEDPLRAHRPAPRRRNITVRKGMKQARMHVLQREHVAIEGRRRRPRREAARLVEEGGAMKAARPARGGSRAGAACRASFRGEVQ